MEWFQKYQYPKLSAFLESVEQEDWFWIAKRLSGNDTGLTGGHQVGAYLPKSFFEIVFPEIVTTEVYNPDSHVYQAYFGGTQSYISPANRIRAIYYNNHFFPERSPKGTRNEFRITGWGGRDCPLQDIDNTGSIWLAGFGQIDINGETQKVCLSWVSQTIEEEIAIEDWLGNTIDPGCFYTQQTVFSDSKTNPDIINQIPEEWSYVFPTGKEIVNFIIERIPQRTKQTVDSLLIKRREVEFEVFAEIERLHVEPLIEKGFGGVDDFVKLANRVTNRRKSRSGRSLELQLASIFAGVGLRFDEQSRTELNKKPDFLFPGEREYHLEPPDPSITLFMLAAKTCCKERWRQILKEASSQKIPVKHLFTLQNGVSENQMIEMNDSLVQLVIPERHRNSFHKDYRQALLNLENFICTVADSQGIDFEGHISDGF